MWTAIIGLAGAIIPAILKLVGMGGSSGATAGDQKAVVRQAGEQLAEGFFVVGEGRKDVDVVVDQRGQQHIAVMAQLDNQNPPDAAQINGVS